MRVELTADELTYIVDRLAYREAHLEEQAAGVPYNTEIHEELGYLRELLDKLENKGGN